MGRRPGSPNWPKLNRMIRQHPVYGEKLKYKDWYKLALDLRREGSNDGEIAAVFATIGMDVCGATISRWIKTRLRIEAQRKAARNRVIEAA